MGLLEKAINFFFAINSINFCFRLFSALFAYVILMALTGKLLVWLIFLTNSAPMGHISISNVVDVICELRLDLTFIRSPEYDILVAGLIEYQLSTFCLPATNNLQQRD